MGINHLLTGMILQGQVKIRKLHVCYLCPGWFVFFHCLNLRIVFLGRECDLGIPGAPTIYPPSNENGGLEEQFGMAYVQGPAVSFRERIR